MLCGRGGTTLFWAEQGREQKSKKAESRKQKAEGGKRNFDLFICLMF